MPKSMSRRPYGRIFADCTLEGIAEYQKRERRYGGLADTLLHTALIPHIQDRPELTRLATTETNSHRGGSDPDCLAAGATRPGAGVALVAALVALLAVQELLKISEAYRVTPMHWPTYIFVGAFFLFLALNPGRDTPLLSTSVFAGSAAFVAPSRRLSFW